MDSSSLIPLVVDTATPLVFIEARVLGSHAHAVVSQLGLGVDAPDCSVAFFTRTSGLILITGAGWYAAYRMCTRLLGTRFVSVLVDGSACNQLAEADRRLLYSQGEEAADDATDGEATDEERRREREEEGDTISESDLHSRISRTPSEFSMSRIRRSMRGGRGLFSIGARRTSREGVVRREGSRAESSISGVITGRVRQLSASSRGSRVPEESGIRPSTSSRVSEASASLRIVWENSQQAWDDEFGSPDERNLSHLDTGASIGDMASIFDDVMSVASLGSAFPGSSRGQGEDRLRLISTSTGESFTLDESGLHRVDRDDLPGTSGLASDDDVARVSDLPCMRDSTYMYRSVVVPGSEFGESDAMSTSSRISALSRMRRTAGGATGLWGLSDQASGMGRSSPIHRTGSNSPRTSAERELARGNQPSTSKAPSMTKSHRRGASRMEQSHDSGCVFMTQSGSSRAASSGKRSNTMFDSAIDADLSLSSDENDAVLQTTAEEEKTPRRERKGDEYAASTQSLEWDEEDDLRALRIDPQDIPELPAIGSVAAPDSRDLMVFAKERFSPKSAQFKAISDLYSKRRLRRIGRADSSRSDLEGLLSTAAYHQVPLVRGRPEELIQRIRLAHERYNCLRRWRSSGGWEGLLASVDQLRAVQMRAVRDPSSVDGAIEGMRVLLALTACEVFDQKMAGAKGAEWLTVERPDEALERIQRDCFDEMEWRLVAEAFFVNVELFEYKTALGSAPAMSTILLGPMSNRDPGKIRTLLYLKAASLGGEVLVAPQHRLVPLYFIPDDF